MKSYPYIGENKHGVQALLYKEGLGVIISETNKGEPVYSHWAKPERYFNITPIYLRNTKIKIESPEHSELVQKLVFGAGGQ